MPIIVRVVWLASSFSAAAIGVSASIQAVPFYTQLVRPGWAPPPDIFGPVWTVLYALMGIAAWLVWRVGGFRAARAALTLFLVQLAVNALWSWLFFGWHLGALAFADIRSEEHTSELQSLMRISYAVFCLKKKKNKILKTKHN